MKDLIRRLFTLALIAVFVTSCSVTIGKLAQYWLAHQDYQQAQEIIAPEPEPEPEPVPQPEPEPEPEPIVDPLADDPYAQTLQGIDFAELLATNEDVIGWILIPDTPIDYPIMQADNNDYYLNHTWLKNYNVAGSIFMEQLCAPDFSDFNTIVYGHRMKNNSMFGSLKYYNDPAYWQAHPSVYIATPEWVRRYDVFASMEPSIKEVTYRVQIKKDETKQTFLDFTMSHTQIDTGILPTVEDQILTLSTCTGNGHATRWVVQARLAAESPAAVLTEEEPALPAAEAQVG